MFSRDVEPENIPTSIEWSSFCTTFPPAHIFPTIFEVCYLDWWEIISHFIDLYFLIVSNAEYFFMCLLVIHFLPWVFLWEVFAHFLSPYFSRIFEYFWLILCHISWISSFYLMCWTYFFSHSVNPLLVLAHIYLTVQKL